MSHDTRLATQQPNTTTLQRALSLFVTHASVNVAVLKKLVARTQFYVSNVTHLVVGTLFCSFCFRPGHAVTNDHAPPTEGNCAISCETTDNSFLCSGEILLIFYFQKLPFVTKKSEIIRPWAKLRKGVTPKDRAYSLYVGWRKTQVVVVGLGVHQKCPKHFLHILCNYQSSCQTLIDDEAELTFWAWKQENKPLVK